MNDALCDNSTIFRADPSPEVDVAWDLISARDFEIITVPSSEIMLAGKGPLTAGWAPTSWNRGSNAYIAQVDVFHQTHCLNELRKEIHSEYYYSADFEPSALHSEHKKQTHNWVHNANISELQTRPFPDFNASKMCRNFDALLEQAKDAAVKDLQGKWGILVVPKGVKVIEENGYA